MSREGRGSEGGGEARSGLVIKLSEQPTEERAQAPQLHSVGLINR